MNLTARQLHFEAVKVGDELPPLVKPPVDRLQIARYVGASGDFNPLSCDEVHARNSGFPSLIAPAMLGMGFLGELVVDWVRGARLRKFQARFVKIVWPGDVLTARGRVVDRRFEEGGRYVIDIEAWAENQKGELVVRGLATVQLYYNAEDEARQRAGGPPLVVTPQEEAERLAKLSRAQPQRAAAKSAAVKALAPPKPAAPAPARPVPAPAPAVRPAAAPVAPPRVAPKPVAPAQPVSAPSAAAKPTAGKTSAKKPAARPAAAKASRSAKAAASAKARPAARHPPGARPHPAGKPKPAVRAAARAAKRPASKDEKAASARSRSGAAVKKPSGKKRR